MVEKIVYEDDCLAERREITIDFTGKNPFEVCKSVESVLVDVLEIDASDYEEREFKWDKSSEPCSFYLRGCAEKGIDKRTKIIFEIIMKGFQSSSSKEGSVSIRISAKLLTSYELVSPFQRSFFYKSLLRIYNFFFYWRVRRNYLYLCQEFLYKLRDTYKSLLKVG